MRQEPKQPNQVRGNKIKCPKFIQCPLCYGCRSYSSHDLDCINCVEENKKKNICNKDLHKDDVITQFITKDKIKFEETITFKSEGVIMKVYVVYSCYSEAYEDPSIFFEVCSSLEKAKEVFTEYKSNSMQQAEDRYVFLNDEFDEENFNVEFDTKEEERTFECREVNGNRCWEAYIVEQDLLI